MIYSPQLCTQISQIQQTMVHILIYLDTEKSAKDLVSKLLMAKLISSAIIDGNKEVYVMKRGQLITQNKNVITAQTKSLLFTEIEEFIENEYTDKIQVISIPIIASNRIFETSLLNNTKKI